MELKTTVSVPALAAFLTPLLPGPRHSALNVKVDGDAVYVRILDEVKACRIISP